MCCLCLVSVGGIGTQQNFRQAAKHFQTTAQFSESPTHPPPESLLTPPPPHCRLPNHKVLPRLHVQSGAGVDTVLPFGSGGWWNTAAVSPAHITCTHHQHTSPVYTTSTHQHTSPAHSPAHVTNTRHQHMSPAHVTSTLTSTLTSVHHQHTPQHTSPAHPT